MMQALNAQAAVGPIALSPEGYYNDVAMKHSKFTINCKSAEMFPCGSGDWVTCHIPSS